MEPNSRRSDANGPGRSRFLASYMDDCWEPAEAAALLRKLAVEAGAGGAPTGTPLCLRVVGNDIGHAEMIQADHECDRSEMPGTASYLWVLWSDSPPTRERMIALYNEFLAASDDCGA